MTITNEPTAPRASVRRASDAAWSAAPVRELDLGDCRVSHRVVGEGPDVLFVHGWPLHSATFRHVVPALADRFRCHMIDLPGAGGSYEAPRERIDLRVHPETLHAAVERLGLTRYALVAHDSGAVVARLLAARDPRVSALVISGSEIPGHHPNLLKVYLWAARARLDWALLAVLQLGPVRRSTLGLGGIFHEVAHGEGEFDRLFLAPLLRSPARVRMQLALLRRFDWSLVDELAQVHARIQAPVQLIWGEGDPYFPVDKARAMAPQFPGGAEFVAIPQARLFVHEEHPRVFAEHCCRFLLAHAEAPTVMHA